MNLVHPLRLLGMLVITALLFPLPACNVVTTHSLGTTSHCFISSPITYLSDSSEFLIGSFIFNLLPALLIVISFALITRLFKVHFEARRYLSVILWFVLGL